MTRERTDGPERRKVPRNEATSYVEVREEATKKLLGMIVDLNQIGMRLQSKKPIEKAKIYRMRINLSRPVLDRYEIVVEGHCVWSRQADRDTFLAGFEFKKLSKINQDMIEMLIMSPWFREMKYMNETTV